MPLGGRANSSTPRKRSSSASRRLAAERDEDLERGEIEPAQEARIVGHAPRPPISSP
jgi:hypothetical protein